MPTRDAHRDFILLGAIDFKGWERGVIVGISCVAILCVRSGDKRIDRQKHKLKVMRER